MSWWIVFNLIVIAFYAGRVYELHKSQKDFDALAAAAMRIHEVNKELMKEKT